MSVSGTFPPFADVRAVVVIGGAVVVIGGKAEEA
jgi:hypothetical protein